MRVVRPDRRRGSDEDDEGLLSFDVGFVSVTLLERTVTKAERDAWRREDEERDRRRIPIGFRAPPTRG